MDSLKERIARVQNGPRATEARLIEGELRLTLPTGATVSIPARSLKPLQNLSDAQLRDVRVTAGGQVLLWPEAGQSIAVEGVLEAATGLRHAKYDAVATGAQGGAARTPAKWDASRANGAKGGRPRKTPVAA